MSSPEKNPNVQLTFHKCDLIPHDGANTDIIIFDTIITIRITIGLSVLNAVRMEVKLYIKQLLEKPPLRVCNVSECIQDGTYKYETDALIVESRGALTVTPKFVNEFFSVVDENLNAIKKNNLIELRQLCDLESTLGMSIHTLLEGKTFCLNHELKIRDGILALGLETDITLEYIPQCV